MFATHAKLDFSGPPFAHPKREVLTEMSHLDLLLTIYAIALDGQGNLRLSY